MPSHLQLLYMDPNSHQGGRVPFGDLSNTLPNSSNAPPREETEAEAREKERVNKRRREKYAEDKKASKPKATVVDAEEEKRKHEAKLKKRRESYALSRKLAKESASAEQTDDIDLPDINNSASREQSQTDNGTIIDLTNDGLNSVTGKTSWHKIHLICPNIGN